MSVRLTLLAPLALLCACSGSPVPPTWVAHIEALESVAEPLPEPRSGDWLAEHDEDGQTFAAWLAQDSPLPRGERSKLYIQPLGEFDPPGRALVERAAEYLGLTFGTRVEVLPDLSLDIVPSDARRPSARGFGEQLLTTWVLHDLLRARLPEDAAALIAFTSADLWPGKGWNFVFGSASLSRRVGVWSLARFGDPAESEDAARTALLRTLKVAAHETGHMFGIEHCRAWSCNMNGSNNLNESDRQPLALCPQCVAKVAWAGEQDLAQRYAALAAWCAAQGLDEQARRFVFLGGVLTDWGRVERPAGP